jgi:anti-sigma B factor antagonist
MSTAVGPMRGSEGRPLDARIEQVVPPAVTSSRSFGGLRVDLAIGDDLHVAVAGEVDLTNASDLESVVFEHATRTGVVLDLADVTFLDSSGLRILIRLRGRIHTGGRRFRLGRVSAAVSRLLDVSGLLAFFEFENARVCPVCSGAVPDGPLTICPHCRGRL